MAEIKDGDKKEQTIKIKVCKEDGTFGYVDISVSTEYDAPSGEWCLGNDALRKIDETKLDYCLKNCKKVNEKDWCKDCFKKKRLEKIDKWLSERIRKFNEACSKSKGGLQTFKGYSEKGVKSVFNKNGIDKLKIIGEDGRIDENFRKVNENALKVAILLIMGTSLLFAGGIAVLSWVLAS